MAESVSATANIVGKAPAGESTDTSAEVVSSLTSYLSSLGLHEGHLKKVASMLQATHGDDQAVQVAESARPVYREPVAKKTIGLYVAEEQQILKEAYRSFFNSQPDIDMLGCSDDTSSESLIWAATNLKPNVMVLGVKTLQAATVEKMEMLRDAHPQLALVLLFAFYDVHGIKALREFSSDAPGGCAYLLKHTINTVDQLSQVIYSLVEGRIIVDPIVMEGMIRTGDAQSGFLKDLTPRALEVLSWMAKGYRNDTIAEVLSRDVKTIERHINNIYGALQDTDKSGSTHPRVRAALMYLRATGLLSTEHVIEG